MTLKLAFTGTGYIANIHAAAAQKVAGVGLTAVSNHHPTSRQTFAETFNIPRQYDNVADLLADGDVDAISINTPNALHAPEAIAALDAGVHVMVEKPMALNAAEAEAMIAASQRSGALLMVAHCWRFDEEVLWLKQQMEPLGAIIRTKGYGVHVNWGPGGWFTQAALAGGGALADMGIHAIDTARFLLGDPLPQSVFARIGTYYGDYDVDDTGTIVVTWDNGCTSTIESGWWQPYAGGPEASTELYGRFGFGSLFPTRVQVGEETAVNPNFPHPRPIHCPQTMYDAQLAYFIACIRAGQQPTPGGHEGLINMKIVDAAYESSRTGQTIMIR